MLIEMTWWPRRHTSCKCNFFKCILKQHLKDPLSKYMSVCVRKHWHSCRQQPLLNSKYLNGQVIMLFCVYLSNNVNFCYYFVAFRSSWRPLQGPVLLTCAPTRASFVVPWWPHCFSAPILKSSEDDSVWHVIWIRLRSCMPPRQKIVCCGLCVCVCACWPLLESLK